MGLKEDFKMMMDARGTVLALIDRWQPGPCATEKAYERSLLAFLRESLPGVDVTPQFGIGRASADICVKKRVLIEIKKDLKSTGECQRLIGQLHEYDEWRGAVVILLMGATCPDMLSNVKKATSKLTSGFFADSDKFAVIVKP